MLFIAANCAKLVASLFKILRAGFDGKYHMPSEDALIERRHVVQPSTSILVRDIIDVVTCQANELCLSSTQVL